MCGSDSSHRLSSGASFVSVVRDCVEYLSVGLGRARQPILHKRAGYSLVELLIVISLMGILAGLILPRFEPSIHDQLQSTAQIVVADFAYARDLAVTNASTYRVTFDLQQNRYVLQHSGANTLLNALPRTAFHQPTDPADHQTTDMDELPHTGPTVEIVGVEEVAAVMSSVNDLEFGPLGGLTRSRETVIWLGCGSGENRRYLSVCVDPITGLASIGEFQSVPN